jgi:hypothetical protein
VLVHRIITRAESRLRGHSGAQMLKEIIDTVFVPVEEEAVSGEG